MANRNSVLSYSTVTTLKSLLSKGVATTGMSCPVCLHSLEECYLSLGLADSQLWEFSYLDIVPLREESCRDLLVLGHKQEEKVGSTESGR